jgi:hypothetical protein
MTEQKKTEEWALRCLNLIREYGFSDRYALIGAENIWANILCNTYESYLKSNPDAPVLAWEQVVEWQIDNLLKTTENVRQLLADQALKDKGKNVIPFPSVVKQ